MRPESAWQIAYRAAMAVLRNHHDAEEVAQDSLMAFLSRDQTAYTRRQQEGFIRQHAKWRALDRRKFLKRRLAADDAAGHEFGETSVWTEGALMAWLGHDDDEDEEVAQDAPSEVVYTRLCADRDAIREARTFT